MAKTLPPDTREPLEEFFAYVLLNVMTGMIKATSVEKEFAQIKEAARKLTGTEMQRIAALAGKYYVEHAKPSPKKLSKQRVLTLKKEALEFALKQ